MPGAGGWTCGFYRFAELVICSDYSQTIVFVERTGGGESARRNAEGIRKRMTCNGL
jgi:hypothetical protein